MIERVWHKKSQFLFGRSAPKQNRKKNTETADFPFHFLPPSFLIAQPNQVHFGLSTAENPQFQWQTSASNRNNENKLEVHRPGKGGRVTGKARTKPEDNLLLPIVQAKKQELSSKTHCSLSFSVAIYFFCCHNPFHNSKSKNTGTASPRPPKPLPPLFLSCCSSKSRASGHHSYFPPG